MAHFTNKLSDSVDCISSRLNSDANVKINSGGTNVWLECESASLVGLLSLLIGRISETFNTKSFNLAVSSHYNQSYIDIDFEGGMISIQQLESWLKRSS